jgi:hypothetical protein
MTNGELVAADERSYRASLRTPRSGLLRCRGNTTVYRDKHDDLFGYGRISATRFGPIHRRSSNGDIDRVAVTYRGLGHGACVAVTFTRPPKGPFEIDFNPVGGGDMAYVAVYLLSQGKVRAGSINGNDYHLNTYPADDPSPRTRLDSRAVKAVAADHSTVSFQVASGAAFGYRPPSSTLALPLRWSVTASSARSSDAVPGSGPQQGQDDLAIEQASGKVVKRY